MTKRQRREAKVTELNAALDAASNRAMVENVLLGLVPIVVVDLFCGAGGASQGLLRALQLAGLTPETLRERGYYLRLINVNHWEIAIETIRRNISFAEMYNASVENWDPQQVLNGVRPHLLIAAPECIMYSKARGRRKIKDQSRTTAAWVLDWVRQQPHAVYLENVWEWTTWGPLDEDDNPIKERMGEYFEGFAAEVRSLGYGNFSYGKFCCADYGDPTSRERFFGVAWHDEYDLAASMPPPTHTGFPERFPHLKKHVAIRTCLELDRWSQMVTERPTIHVPTTIRRIKSGFVIQKAFDSPLFGEICDRMEPISASAHKILNARPNKEKLGRELTRAEEKRNKRILDAVRVRTRRRLRAAASVSLGHFEPEEVPAEALHAIAILIGQHAGSGPRTVDEPIMTIDCGGGTGVAQGFLVKANASEKSAFNDATQSIDQPKRTLVTKECAALAQPALVVVQHGEDDIRVLDKDQPAPTLAGHNGFGVAQPAIGLSDATIVNLYSSNVTDDGAAAARANTSPEDPLGSITAGGKHHAVAQGVFGGEGALSEGVILRCYGEKKEGECRAHELGEPIGSIGAEGNQSALAQPVIATLYGQSMTQDLDKPGGAIATNNHSLLAQPTIIPQHVNGKPRTPEVPGPTVMTESRIGLAQPTILPQHFDADPQSLDEPGPSLVTINRMGLAQPTILSNHFGNESQSVDQPGPGATTATGGGLGVTQPVITQNFGERDGQRPRSRTIDEAAFAVTSHGAGMLAQTYAATSADPDGPIMFFFTIGTTRIYINIRYRMLHSSELAKAHSLGHVQFAGTETDAIRQIGNSIPAKTAAAFITHALRPVFGRMGLPIGLAA